MTIKELENRTEMTRANIRFYENEGLLSPKRLDNGYRDYSEEDARTLEKIKLLRQLQLDIDTIRKLQQGALTLDQALFTQLTRLEGDKALIERAAEVCRALERSGVEYGALDPQPYLQQLEAPPAPNREMLPPPPVIQPKRDDTPRACRHPWQRLFARALDLALYRVIFGWLWAAVFWNQGFLLSTGLFGWLLDLALLGFTLAVEPLWLYFLGWTPGKLLFGLKLRNKDGEKLTVAQGWERSWRVFQDGYGWNIPFWGEWKMWQCRKLGLNGMNCWWDAEEDYRYTKVERPFNTGAVYVLLALACSGALWITKPLTELPRNRGDLTVAEFSVNYNQFRSRYADLGFDNVPRLDQEGQWEEEQQDGTIISHGGAASYNSGDGTTYTIKNPVEGTTIWLPLEFTMEDDRITAVTIRMESRDSIIREPWMRDYLVFVAMSGAADGQDLFHFHAADGMYIILEREHYEDVELDYWGLHISQQVDYEGYDSPDEGESLWALDEDTPCHFERVLTISLAEP